MSYSNKQKEQYRAQIDQILPTFFPQETLPQYDVLNAMKYSLCGGGKRVRGTLVLAFYELFGGTHIETALPFAASVEMVHAYSLIHDDLPCMDDDDMRRGQPACHIKFGESTALLAGDGLLTMAFEVLSDQKNQNYFDNEQILSCISILATSSGAKGMIGGQIMDLENENTTISLERLEQTDRLKTGALIIASCLIGSILAGATIEQRKKTAQFGQKIGLAFQIIDDILDVTSTIEQLGKPVESDKKCVKTTYTSVYGLDDAKNMAEQLTEQALKLLFELHENPIFLKEYTLDLVARNY